MSQRLWAKPIAIVFPNKNENKNKNTQKYEQMALMPFFHSLDILP